MKKQLRCLKETILDRDYYPIKEIIKQIISLMGLAEGRLDINVHYDFNSDTIEGVKSV